MSDENRNNRNNRIEIKCQDGKVINTSGVVIFTFGKDENTAFLVQPGLTEIEAWKGECTAKSVIAKASEHFGDHGRNVYDFTIIGKKHEWSVMGSGQYCQVCAAKRKVER